MDNGALTIRGERNEEKREKNDGYHRIERSHGSFYRRFAMPDAADAEHIKATSKDGVLEIEVPKRAVSREKSKSRTELSCGPSPELKLFRRGSPLAIDLSSR